MDECENTLTLSVRNLSMIDQYIPPKVDKPIFRVVRRGSPPVESARYCSAFWDAKGYSGDATTRGRKIDGTLCEFHRNIPQPRDQQPGAGAGGGLGFAILALGGQLTPRRCRS